MWFKSWIEIMKLQNGNLHVHQIWTNELKLKCQFVLLNYEHIVNVDICILNVYTAFL